MNVKNLLALILTFLMLASVFTACSSNEEPSGSDAGTNSPDASDAGDNTDDEEDLVEINFWWTDNNTANTGDGTAFEDVCAAINAITEKEIGVHVNITCVTTADYATQLGLAIANGEQVDVAIYMPGAMSFTNQYGNGYMMDITDIVDEYGQGIKDCLGEALAGGAVDNRLYGICTYRVLNSDGYWCADKGLLEQAGVLEQAEAITSWSDMEAVFQAVLDETGVAPIGGNKYIFETNVMYLFPDGDNIFEDSITYDALGDNLDMIITDQEGNVTSFWEDESVLQMLKRAKRWADAGYIYNESAYTTDSAETLMAQGMFASYIVNSEIGVEVNKAQSIGKELLCLCLTDGKGMVGQGVACRRGEYVPVTSKEPEAAVKFLNLCYTNAELMNTIIWGIEGQTYVVNDKGEACYPEGKDVISSGYHAFDSMFGNQFACLPWENQGGDFRERALENFNNAPRSIYLGLVVNIDGLDSEISAITAVKDEYAGQLRCGLYSDELYAEFMEKLDAAGADTYIARFQDAVSDWMA